MQAGRSWSFQAEVRRGASYSDYNILSAIADGLASDRNIVFAGAMVFFVLLTLGFVYDWRKGVFQWR